MHLAAQKGNNQILKLAIKAIPRANRAAFINARSMVNEAPLLLAAQNGHREAVRTLLHAGADVNCTNTSGETALYLACYHGTAHYPFRPVIDWCVAQATAKWRSNWCVTRSWTSIA